MILRFFNIMLQRDGSQDSNPIYRYTGLQDDHSIRMLTLSAGASDDPLRGNLALFDIDSGQDYETISYTWGETCRLSEIRCDGKRIGITASLAGALLRLRWPNRSRRLWVDQICINQDDEEERSQQVQFMNRIYKNASHVLVWLGEDEQALAKSAFNLVCELDEIFQDGQKREHFRVDHTQNLGSRSEEPWSLMTHVTKRSWFTRAWIVQEIGTNAPATLFWGEAEIDWIVLHRVCQNLTDYYHLRAHFGIRTDIVKYSFKRFVEADRKSRHANRFSFIYELHRARHLHVSDKRDRVFAMLGHYSIRNGQNEKLKTMQASYKKTAMEVYIDVAARALLGGSSLITLAAVQHADSPGKAVRNSRGSTEITDDPLPSWVPDWNSWETKILSEPISVHCAHANTPSRLEIDIFSLVLRVHGVRLDVIEAASRPLKEREFYPVPSDQELAIETLWRDVCLQQQFDLETKYLNGESAFFAYVQTLSDGSVTTASWDTRDYHDISKAEWLAQGAAYLTMAVGQSEDVSLSVRQAAKHGDHSKWSRAANGACKQRKFGRTKEGYYLLGPKVMEAGDIVCVLFGGKTPFCLRPWGSRFLFIGECYVHGLMDGESIEMLERGQLSEEIFELG